MTTATSLFNCNNLTRAQKQTIAVSYYAWFAHEMSRATPEEQAVLRKQDAVVQREFDRRVNAKIAEQMENLHTSKGTSTSGGPPPAPSKKPPTSKKWTPGEPLVFDFANGPYHSVHLGK